MGSSSILKCIILITIITIKKNETSTFFFLGPILKANFIFLVFKIFFFTKGNANFKFKDYIIISHFLSRERKKMRWDTVAIREKGKLRIFFFILFLHHKYVLIEIKHYIYIIGFYRIFYLFFPRFIIQLLFILLLSTMYNKQSK